MNDESYTLRARRVAAMVPGREIIPDGAVVVRQGRVAAAGTWSEVKRDCPPDVRDLGEATLLPGLINAHTHLELSHLCLPPFQGRGYLAWVRWLLALPLAQSDAATIAGATAQLTACGTAGMADIATRCPELTAQGLERAGLEYVVQFERFGYRGDAPLPDIAPGRLSLAGHALYSTDPKSLRAAKVWDREHAMAFSIHLAEHEGEVELLATGTGDFAALLRQRILPPDFSPPGVSPVAWADALGLLDERTLAVHAVKVTPEDIAVLKSRGVTACLCPRSNAVIGVGRAPARALLDAGVPCCLGTDSLASAPDLNLWEELTALLAFCPLRLSEAAALLTTAAARVLGFASLGHLGPGAAARFALLPSGLEEPLGD